MSQGEVSSRLSGFLLEKVDINFIIFVLLNLKSIKYIKDLSGLIAIPMNLIYPFHYLIAFYIDLITLSRSGCLLLRSLSTKSISSTKKESAILELFLVITIVIAT